MNDDNDEGTDMTTPNITTSELEQLQVRIDELEAKLAAADQARAEARNERWQESRKHETFKESVRDALKERVDNDELEREVADSILSDLGLKSLARKFEVVVTVEVTVTGLEAEDEDDAERIAREGVEGSMGSYDFGDSEYDDVSDNIDNVSATEE